MQQYLDLCRRIVDHGEWVENARTGKRCLTVINADLQYDVAANEFPIITTRKSFWKAAIAELLGYLRGYDNAADFRALGTKSWDANCVKSIDFKWQNCLACPTGLVVKPVLSDDSRHPIPCTTKLAREHHLLCDIP